jgi:hypothetical protein
MTWVRITQDGIPPQVLHSARRTIEGRGRLLLLDVGNACGITVPTGQVLPPLGKPGEVSPPLYPKSRRSLGGVGDNAFDKAEDDRLKRGVEKPLTRWQPV